MSRTTFSAKFAGAALALLAAATSPVAAQVIPISSDPQLTNARGIATDGTSLYVTSYSGSTGRIFSVPIAGGTATQRYSYTGPGSTASPLGITAIGANLFWVDPNSGSDTGTEVRRGPANGAGPNTSIYNLGSPIVDGSGIATNGTSLFVADEVQGGVYRMNPDGTGLTQLGTNRYGGFFDREHLNTIAVSGTTAYVADSGRAGFADTPPRVQSIPTTGGTFTDLFVGTLPGFSPSGIAVVSNMIYLSNGNQILSMPTTGGTPTLFVTDPRFGSLQDITFFNNSLYVMDTSSSLGVKIWQVAVPEPSSLALVGVGSLAMLRVGWRKLRGKGVSPVAHA